MPESNDQLLKNTNLFDNLDEKTFKKVASNISEVKFPASTVFIKEGERADALYIIKEGSTQVFTFDDAQNKVILARLEKGEFVGEQALLMATPGWRNANVRALTDIVLLKIEHSVFREILVFDEILKENLEKLGCQQLLEKLKALKAEYNLARYVFDDPEKYEVKEYKTDDLIVVEGTPSDGVYFILTGFVDVYKKNDQGEEEFICSISPGNVFGEVGVIKDQSRLMTIRAQGPVKTSFVEAKVFRELYQSIPEIQRIVETLHRVYQSPQRGQITQYTGDFMDMPAIFSTFQLKDGGKVTSASVLGKNIRSITKPTLEKPKTFIYEDVNVYRELQVMDEILVGVTSFGEWEGLSEIYAMVFDSSLITEEQIKNFKKHGELIAPTEVVEAEVVEDEKQIICNCIYVPRGVISSCIRDGCSSVKEVSKKTGAGTVCGSCIPTIESMIGHESWQPVRISDISPLTDEVRAYRLVSIRDEPLKDFVAGQHLVIQCDIDGNWIERCYTLTSSPGDPENYEIAVKREKLGLFSRWLFDHDKTLPLLRVSKPQGTFTLDTSKTSPVVCFMAGIGITPAVSFTRTMVKFSIDRPLHIYYTASKEEDMAYHEELTSMAEKSDSIKLIKHLTSEKGRMQEKDILEIAEEVPDAAYFICGPTAFQEMIMASLSKAGVGEDRIFVENFTHAGGPQA